MLKADFHIHSKFSMDSQNTPEDIIKRCLELGINCIAVSDHDAVEGALKIQELAPFKVIVAEEVLTSVGEVMAMFIKERIASGISLAEAIASIRAQGGLVNIPHPFDPLRGLRLNAEEWEKFAPEIDIMEVFNARCPFGKPNTKANEFAKEHNLPGTGGSDSHTIGEIGNATVEMDDFNTPQQFLESLRKGAISGHRASPFVHFNSTIAKFKKGL